MKKLNRQGIVTAKGVYLCLLTVYALLREVLAIQQIVGSSVITYGFFGVGMLLTLAMILTNGQVFLRKTQWLPVLFLVICGISTIVNRRFDFASNVKAIAWMFLYFMLLLPQNERDANEERIRRWVLATAVATMSALALISVPMYYFSIDYTYLKPSGFANNQGFSFEFMRLWGVFIDANTAGVYSLVSICFAVYLFSKTKKLFIRILLAVACVILCQLVVLTNSRTALVSLLTAAAWIGIGIAFNRCVGSRKKRVFATLLAVLVAVSATYGAYKAVKFVTPYGKAALQSITTPAFRATVHQTYDRLFKSSNLNITAGYYVEQPAATEPVTTEPMVTDPAVTEPSVTEPSVTEPVGTVPPTEPPLDSLDRTDEKDDLSNGRFKKWKEVLEVFWKMPILGASPRGIASAAKQINSNSSVAKFNFAAHNGFLEVLAGTGILGFVVALAILVWLAADILRNLFAGKMCKEFLMYSAVLLIMVCEMMFISDVFFVLTFGGVVFWLAAGRIFALASGFAKTSE